MLKIEVRLSESRGENPILLLSQREIPLPQDAPVGGNVNVVRLLTPQSNEREPRHDFSSQRRCFVLFFFPSTLVLLLLGLVGSFAGCMLGI